MLSKFLILVFTALSITINPFANDTLNLKKKILIVDEIIKSGATDSAAIWAIRELVFYFRSYDAKKALYYNNILMQIARKTGDRKFEATLLAEKGAFYREQGLLNHALEQLKAASDLWSVLGEKSGVGWTLLEIGNIYYLLNLYEQSEFYFRKVEELAFQSNHFELTYVALNNIGLVKRQTGNYSEAKKYFLKADSVNNDRLLPYNLNSLRYFASIEILEGNKNKALDYYQRAINLYYIEQPKVNNHSATRVVFEVMINIAELFTDLEDFSKAKTALNDAIKFGEENNLVVESVGHLNKAAELSLKLGDPEGAKKSLEKSLKISKPNTMILYQSESYRLLSILYEKEGKIAEAYNAHKLHKTLDDSVFNKELSELMADLRARVETEKTNQQLKLIEQNKELNELKIQRQSDYILALIIGFVLILILFAGLVSRNLYRKKTVEEIQKFNSQLSHANKQLTEVNEVKDKLLSVLAHDLRSPYQIILSYSEIIYEQYEELSEEEIRKFAKDINSVSKKHYVFLKNLLEWVGMQFNKKEFDKSVVLLNDEIDDVIESLKNAAVKKEINLKSELKNEVSILTNKQALRSVLLNLINNSIKYTNTGGNISVNAFDEVERLKISITDDGVGMTKEQCDKLFKLESRNSTMGTMNESGTGFGLVIVYELIKNLGGSISVESEVGKGTIFTVTFEKN